MRQYKRLVTCLTVVGIMCALFSVSALAAQKKVLTWWHIGTSDPIKAYYNEVEKAFEALHPDIDIQQNRIENDPYKTALQVAVGSDDTPDIFQTWTGEFTAKYVRGKNVLDITDYLNEDGWADTFYPAGLESYTINDRIYGIPILMGTKYFFYNKELFNELGLTEPKTWDEFLEVCETLKQNGHTPIAFGNRDRWPACHYITILNQKIVGEDRLDEVYALTGGDFSDPGFVDALERFKLLQDQGYFYPHANAIETETVNKLFAAGQQGVMFYTWAGDMERTPPKFEFGYFPFPAIPEGRGDQNYIIGAPEGFVISSKAKYPDEAVEFLKFLTSAEWAEKYVSVTGNSSGVMGATNPETASPLVYETTKMMESATGFALWLDTIVEVSISNVYLNGIQAMLNGEKTPQQVMNEVYAQAQKVKAEYAQ